MLRGPHCQTSHCAVLSNSYTHACVLRVSSCTLASLSVQLGSITHNLMVMHSCRHLVHVQVSNAHGWHGARNMARANEQQKQQEKQKQQQKLKQKQQQQQKKQKKQKRKEKQQQNGGGETGTVSVDGVKARTHLPFAHTASSDTTVCWNLSCSRLVLCA